MGIPTRRINWSIFGRESHTFHQITTDWFAPRYLGWRGCWGRCCGLHWLFLAKIIEVEKLVRWRSWYTISVLGEKHTRVLMKNNNSITRCLKIRQNKLTLFENDSKCRIWFFGILAFFTNFCRIKIDLSGNTVWPQASSFQKLAQMDQFWHF